MGEFFGRYDVVAWTSSWAPVIIPLVFIVTAIISACLDGLWQRKKSLSSLVDILWVTASVVAFGLAALLIAYERPRTDATNWRMDVKGRVGAVAVELQAYRDTFCSAPTSGPDTVVCSDLANLSAITRRISDEARNMRFENRITPYPVDGLARVPANPTAVLQLRRIRGLMVWSNVAIANYNANYERVSLKVVEGIVAFWTFLFPALGALRLHRSIDELLRRLGLRPEDVVARAKAAAGAPAE